MAKRTEQNFDLNEVAKVIAAEVGLPLRQVLAAIELFNAGNTIPFVARYRKEATGGIDEVALRAIEDALEKAATLAARKATVLKTIADQGNLTEELRAAIESCQELRTLEAIYLPFKPKRRSRATVARDRGLQPLADLIVQQATLDGSRKQILQRYVDTENDSFG